MNGISKRQTIHEDFGQLNARFDAQHANEKLRLSQNQSMMEEQKFFAMQ